MVSSVGGMEPGESTKLNDDVMEVMGARSGSDAPLYTARVQKYLELNQKRQRAAAARRHVLHRQANRKRSPVNKTTHAAKLKNRSPENLRRKKLPPKQSSRSRSPEAVDACPPRRRRRRRSNRRRSRRRSRCAPKRRRSRSRRKRCRSCRRRRRRCRRCG